MSDRFDMLDVHHIEFYTTDATSVRDRIQAALGMSLVAKADLTTGCDACSSFVLRSEDATFVVTAPSALRAAESELPLRCPIPGYDGDAAFDFVRVHGLAVRTIGFKVADAAAAYLISVANGGQGVLPPARIVDDASGEEQTVSEIKAYGEGDVVIRFVSGNFGGPFLANYEAVEDAEAPEPLGVRRVDHIGASATDERKAIAYLANATGMHRGVTFHTGDIGTSASGLTFEVVSNNEGTILFNITEPTQGTAVKSPMQRFLDHHRGSGVQHIALEARDIFAAVRRMRAKRGSGLGFMPRPSAEYYRELPKRIGDVLTAEQFAAVEELGIMVDRSGDGTLLQIFTGAVGDRPTLFLELIQRIGCMREAPRSAASSEEEAGAVLVQQPGCGGFGKGNVKELYACMEKYDERLKELAPSSGASSAMDEHAA